MLPTSKSQQTVDYYFVLLKTFAACFVLPSTLIVCNGVRESVSFKCVPSFTSYHGNNQSYYKLQLTENKGTLFIFNVRTY